MKRESTGKWSLLVIALFVCAGFVLVLGRGQADEGNGKEEGGNGVKPVRAVQPKPLSESVKRGLSWLAETQNEDGGWAQGEESRGMGQGRDDIRDRSNLGDTCAAALALLRSGSTPSEGIFVANLRRAVAYVCEKVEASDGESLWVTDVRGTRLQQKIGTFVDTFLAALVLSEVKGRMGDEKGEKRLAAALGEVIAKIERNQRKDGTWGNQGWAPTLGRSLAGKALNVAAQNGVEVDETVRARAEKQARGQFNRKTGAFGPSGSAGVGLYAAASSLGGMQNSDNTNGVLRGELEKRLKEAKAPAERKEAEDMLGRFDANRRDLTAAKQAVSARVDEEGFVRGFGSNGGEEFLSYMHISESLVVEGGEAWEKWDRAMRANLGRVQNKDGSWTGHHCITGRTFCTSAAMLVLMADRAPLPLATKKIGKH